MIERVIKKLKQMYSLIILGTTHDFMNTDFVKQLPWLFPMGGDDGIKSP